MPDALKVARAQAESVRYAGDTARGQTKRGYVSRLGALKSNLNQSELRVSQEVTPALHHVLEEVCKNLHIPLEAVDAFIYASPTIQAECFSGNSHECVIRFSSSLVDILDEREFGFVAGHELGHFLLEHSNARMDPEKASLEYFMQQRSQEISVDRIGLIACGSLDVAIKALMKTVSGLTSKHLRFNVGSFISQLKSSSFHLNETASHPSMLIRCRALLWFSLNDAYTTSLQAESKETLSMLDERIRKDFHKYVDGSAKEKIQKVKDDLAMWIVADKIVQDDVFSISEQQEFEKVFGKDALDSLKKFLMEIPSAQVQDVVYERVKSTREELEKLIPESFESEVHKIKQWAETLNG